MTEWLASSAASILSAAWVTDLQHWEFTSSSPEETQALGGVLGRLASPGLVVLLSGDLGAGKTCFAQGVGSGLGVPASSPVTSPSYTLLNVHQGRLSLYHFDLYRLSRVDDLTDLGYDDYAEGEGVTLVEWADRMTTDLPAALSVRITRLSEQQRRFMIHAMDPRGKKLLEQLVRSLAKPT